MKRTLEEFFRRIDAIVEQVGYYILVDGEPKKVPMMVWAAWFGKHKQLAYDHGEGWEVSSIFLGFDHSPFRDKLEDKELWETLVRGTEGEYDIYRFTSWKQCEAFHREAVQRLGTE